MRSHLWNRLRGLPNLVLMVNKVCNREILKTLIRGFINYFEVMSVQLYFFSTGTSKSSNYRKVFFSQTDFCCFSVYIYIEEEITEELYWCIMFPQRIFEIDSLNISFNLEIFFLWELLTSSQRIAPELLIIFSGV